MSLFSVAMATIAVPRASSVRRLSPFPGKPTIPNKAPSNALLPHNPSDLVGISCRFATRLYERGSPLQLPFFSPYSAAAFPFSIAFDRASRTCQPTLGHGQPCQFAMVSVGPCAELLRPTVAQNRPVSESYAQAEAQTPTYTRRPTK
jgi:hypothetical protein